MKMPHRNELKTSTVNAIKEIRLGNQYNCTDTIHGNQPSSKSEYFSIFGVYYTLSVVPKKNYPLSLLCK